MPDEIPAVDPLPVPPVENEPEAPAPEAPQPEINEYAQILHRLTRVEEAIRRIDANALD